MTHPDVVNEAVAEFSLCQTRALEHEKVRPLHPAPSDVHDFTVFALGTYGIATELQNHTLCAEAAGMLATISRRFGEFNEKELWLLTQSVHSVLTYPVPKFSSTFDILVTGTASVIDYYREGDGSPAIGFFGARATCCARMSARRPLMN